MADKFGHSDQVSNAAFNLSDPAFNKGLANVGIEMPTGGNGETNTAQLSYAKPPSGTNLTPSGTQSQINKRGMGSNDSVGFANQKPPGRGSK